MCFRLLVALLSGSIYAEDGSIAELRGIGDVITQNTTDTNTASTIQQTQQTQQTNTTNTTDNMLWRLGLVYPWALMPTYAELCKL